MIFCWGATGIQEDKTGVICREAWTVNSFGKLPWGGSKRGGVRVAFWVVGVAHGVR